MPNISLRDKQSLETLAERVLGDANVASVTAATLLRHGVKVEELQAVVTSYAALPPEVRPFEIKSHANDSNLTEYGLLIRRRGSKTAVKT